MDALNNERQTTATEVSRLLPSTTTDKKLKKIKDKKSKADSDSNIVSKETKATRSSSVGGKISAKFRSLGRSSKSRRSESIKSNTSNGSDISVFNAAELMVGRSISVSTLPGENGRDLSVSSSTSGTLLSKVNEFQNENKNRWSSFTLPPEKPQRLQSFVDETITKDALEKEKLSEASQPSFSAVDERENEREEELHSTIHQSPSTLPLPRSPVEDQSKVDLEDSKNVEMQSRCLLCCCFGI